MSTIYPQHPCFAADSTVGIKKIADFHRFDIDFTFPLLCFLHPGNILNLCSSEQTKPKTTGKTQESYRPRLPELSPASAAAIAADGIMIIADNT
ncbi:MAG: hypothetical protein IJB55_05735 [Firmicutes bacterium]|nr:hypothetical protein [Bacillota bacterium]